MVWEGGIRKNNNIIKGSDIVIFILIACKKTSCDEPGEKHPLELDNFQKITKFDTSKPSLYTISPLTWASSHHLSKKNVATRRMHQKYFVFNLYLG